MRGMAELVMYVNPAELALWSYEKGRRRLRRLGAGGRLFWVHMMARRLLWGSSRGSGERSRVSALLFPTVSVTLAKIKTLPRKMGVMSCQPAKEEYYFKHYSITLKKRKCETQGKEGKRGLWLERKWHVSWNQSFLRLFWAQFQEEVPVIKTNNR